VIGRRHVYEQGRFTIEIERPPNQGRITSGDMKRNFSEMLFGGSWPEDDRSPHFCGMNLAEWCLS